MRDGECKSESDKDNYSWLYFQFEQNVNIDIRNVRYRDILNVYIYQILTSHWIFLFNCASLIFSLTCKQSRQCVCRIFLWELSNIKTGLCSAWTQPQKNWNVVSGWSHSHWKTCSIPFLSMSHLWQSCIFWTIMITSEYWARFQGTCSIYLSSLEKNKNNVN